MAINPVHGTRAVVYCRVSTEEQDREGTSLDSQEERCRAYAESQGWEIVGEPVREVGSGFNRDKRHRPKLWQVREMVKAGRVEVVLCYALDRLSRRQVDVAIIAEECADAGARLAFVTESFEKTAIGEFLRSATAFAAEFEREKILERTQRGLRERVEGKDGVPGMPLPARRPIYGYLWADDKKSRLVVAEPAAEIVRRIFREIAAGATIGRVADGLTAEGVQTPTGRSPRWTKSTVQGLLKQTAYVGEYRAYSFYLAEQVGTRADKQGQMVRRSLRRPESETVLLPHVAPALVDRAIFDAAQERLARNAAASGARRPYDPESSLLRGGFVVCGWCGGNMSATEKRGRTIYRCSRRLRKDRDCPSVTMGAAVLDRIVWGRVCRVLRDPNQLVLDAERMRETDPTAGELARLAKLIAKVEQSQRSVAQAVAMLDGNEDAIAPLVAQLDALAAQRRHLLADAADAEQRRSRWGATRDRFDGLTGHLRMMAELRGDPYEYDFATKRAALEWLGAKVQVFRTYPEKRKVPLADRIRKAGESDPAPAFVVTGRVPLDGFPPDNRPPFDHLPPFVPGFSATDSGSASAASPLSGRPGSTAWSAGSAVWTGPGPPRPTNCVGSSTSAPSPAS